MPLNNTFSGEVSPEQAAELVHDAETGEYRELVGVDTNDSSIEEALDVGVIEILPLHILVGAKETFEAALKNGEPLRNIDPVFGQGDYYTQKEIYEEIEALDVQIRVAESMQALDSAFKDPEVRQAYIEELEQAAEVPSQENEVMSPDSLQVKPVVAPDIPQGPSM